MKFGFLRNYTTWWAHGEVYSAFQEMGECSTSMGDADEYDGCTHMVLDNMRSTRGKLKVKMKVKVVWRKVRDYVRYDLKEIAFPSSLPDPPHFKKRRKLTWKERYLVMKEATRLYAASWVRDIGPELRPNEYKKKALSEDEHRATGSTGETEPSTLEDIAVAARGGMETLRPALQRVYMTRASAYRDALKSFIHGYQEGIQEVMEKKDNPEPHQQNNDPEPHQQKNDSKMST